MQNKQIIIDIPNFLKKDSQPKKTISSSLLKCYFSSVWDTTLLFIRENFELKKTRIEVKSPSKEEQVENVECIEMTSEKNPIHELQALRNLIHNYFCLGNTELRDYYFNYEENVGLEYQGAIEHPIQTLTQIISKDIGPYMDELREKLENNGIQLTYSFPLNGEYGIVTVTNKTKEKTRS